MQLQAGRAVLWNRNRECGARMRRIIVPLMVAIVCAIASYKVLPRAVESYALLYARYLCWRKTRRARRQATAAAARIERSNRHAPGGPGWTHMKEPIRLVHSSDRVG